jgi:hypothetical protein
MQRVEKMILVLLWVALTAGVCIAQSQQTEPAEPSENVISGTVAAIGYPVGGGGTKVTWSQRRLHPRPVAKPGWRPRKAAQTSP